MQVDISRRYMQTKLSSSDSCLWTDRDVASRLQASVRTIIDWRNAGKLPFIRIGRSIRYRPESVTAALARMEKGGI